MIRTPWTTFQSGTPLMHFQSGWMTSQPCSAFLQLQSWSLYRPSLGPRVQVFQACEQNTCWMLPLVPMHRNVNSGMCNVLYQVVWILESLPGCLVHLLPLLLRKMDGFRPIAIGEVFRRLVSQSRLFSRQVKIARSFATLWSGWCGSLWRSESSFSFSEETYF